MRFKQMLKKEFHLKGVLTLCGEAVGLFVLMATSAFTLFLVSELPYIAVQ